MALFKTSVNAPVASNPSGGWGSIYATPKTIVESKPKVTAAPVGVPIDSPLAGPGIRNTMYINPVQIKATTAPVVSPLTQTATPTVIAPAQFVGPVLPVGGLNIASNVKAPVITSPTTSTLTIGGSGTSSTGVTTSVPTKVNVSTLIPIGPSLNLGSIRPPSETTTKAVTPTVLTPAQIAEMASMGPKLQDTVTTTKPATVTTSAATTSPLLGPISPTFTFGGPNVLSPTTKTTTPATVGTTEKTTADTVGTVAPTVMTPEKLAEISTMGPNIQAGYDKNAALTKAQETLTTTTTTPTKATGDTLMIAGKDTSSPGVTTKTAAEISAEIPILSKSSIDNLLTKNIDKGDPNIITGEALKDAEMKKRIDPALGNLTSINAAITKGAASLGIVKSEAVQGMSGTKTTSYSGDLNAVAKSLGIDPDLYKKQSIGQYGSKTTYVDQDDLYNAINDKANELGLYSITERGSGSAKNAKHTTTLYQNVNGELKPILDDKGVAVQSQFRAPTYQQDDGFFSSLLDLAKTVAPIALPFLLPGAGAALSSTFTSMGMGAVAAGAASGAVLNAGVAALTGGDIGKALAVGAIGGGMSVAATDVANSIVGAENVTKLAGIINKTPLETAKLIAGGVSTGLSSAVIDPENIATNIIANVAGNFASQEAKDFINKNIKIDNVNVAANAAASTADIATEALFKGQDVTQALKNSALSIGSTALKQYAGLDKPETPAPVEERSIDATKLAGDIDWDTLTKSQKEYLTSSTAELIGSDIGGKSVIDLNIREARETDPKIFEGANLRYGPDQRVGSLYQVTNKNGEIFQARDVTESSGAKYTVYFDPKTGKTGQSPTDISEGANANISGDGKSLSVVEVTGGKALTGAEQLLEQPVDFSQTKKDIISTITSGVGAQPSSPVEQTIRLENAAQVASDAAIEAVTRYNLNPTVTNKAIADKAVLDAELSQKVADFSKTTLNLSGPLQPSTTGSTTATTTTAPTSNTSITIPKDSSGAVTTTGGTSGVSLGIPTGVTGGAPSGVPGGVPDGVIGGVTQGVTSSVPGGTVVGTPEGVPGGVPGVNIPIVPVVPPIELPVIPPVIPPTVPPIVPPIKPPVVPPVLVPKKPVVTKKSTRKQTIEEISKTPLPKRPIGDLYPISTIMMTPEEIAERASLKRSKSMNLGGLAQFRGN